MHVTGRRPDGYHDLLSLICCIGLYDTITLVPGADRSAVRCSHAHVPEDDTNLAARAAQVFYTASGISDQAAIAIEKKIPVGAGLGGGSSNAASVLSALNRHYGRPFSTDELMALGLSIGADVPFFIYGKPALVSGIGESIQPFENLRPCPVVLIFPGVCVSTATVYKNLNFGLTKRKNKHNYRDLSDYRFRVDNDLETVAPAHCPDILAAKAALIRQGASAAAMSGSGSGVFGLFPDRQTARSACAALARKAQWQVTLTRMIV